MQTSHSEILPMIDLYRSKMLSTDTATSGWISVNELNALINDNGANGVRIYYGRHTDTEEVSVILVATTDTTTPSAPTIENSSDILDTGLDGLPITSGSYAGYAVDSIPLCPPNCSPNHL